jgi:FMN reductase
MPHTAIAIAASASRISKSRRLAEHALAAASAGGFIPRLIDVGALPADALLGRTKNPAVEDALSAAAGASLLVVATPVYRASYSGLLKVFFDLFASDALAGTVAVPIVTGGAPAHQLVIDHALRPLLASVGALVVRSGIYATDAQFGPDGPEQAVIQQIDRAIVEAIAQVARR